MVNQNFYISVVDYAFHPNSLTIVVGDTIYFDIYGEKIKKIIGDIESPELRYGNSWQYRFDKVGQFNLTCQDYPDMKCVINVVKLKDIKDPYRKLMYEML